MEDEHHWSTAICHNTADGIRCITVVYTAQPKEKEKEGAFLPLIFFFPIEKKNKIIQKSDSEPFKWIEVL